jgi:nucleoside-diphosphate-sugar epimerase
MKLSIEEGADLLGQVLVTGASGFIGRRLVRPGDRFLTRKADVTGDANVGDLLDPVSLSLACEGVDTVFHCAGYAHAFSSSDPQEHQRINFEGTRNLVEAAAQGGVKRFVFLSSVKAMVEPGDHCVDEDWPGEPITAYGKAKREAERAVLDVGGQHGMHVVNLRLAMVYGRGGRGNLERMARGIEAGWFPPLPETHNKRSLVHVDDVVSAIRLVAAHPRAKGRTYIVSGSQAYSGQQIYEAIRSALGMPAARWHVPVWVLRSGGLVGNVLSTLTGRPFLLNSEAVSRLLGSECYSSARIESELGWKATVCLEDGLKEMLTV